MERLLATLLTVLSFSTLPFSHARPPGPERTIYGEDGRIEAHEESDALLREAALSVAALVGPQVLGREGDAYVPRYVGTLGEIHRLCPSERFSSQKVLSVCTGFLIAEDLLVTAGHCARPMDRSACGLQTWVFDYTANNAQGDGPSSFAPDQVYRCERLVTSVYEEGEGLDYAIIKLDRPVEGRRPLPLAASAQIEIGTELAVMGHPLGLSLKIARGAKVIRDGGHYFTANLDTFRGNSGSPVLNVQTGEVEGILVRGRPDFAFTPKGCKVHNVCSEDGNECTTSSDQDMEHANKISVVKDALKGLGL